MQSKAESIEAYLKEIPETKRLYFEKLRITIIQNIPAGFKEQMSYSMIGYIVPHSIYPNGYHCNPKLPLPFVNIASQKKFMVLYHMGLYANKELLNWFVNQYPNYSKYKLDMGKSCIRFKKYEDIPMELIGKLMKKITVKEWINIYEKEIKKK